MEGLVMEGIIEGGGFRILCRFLCLFFSPKTIPKGISGRILFGQRRYLLWERQVFSCLL